MYRFIPRPGIPFRTNVPRPSPSGNVPYSPTPDSNIAKPPYRVPRETIPYGQTNTPFEVPTGLFPFTGRRSLQQDISLAYSGLPLEAQTQFYDILRAIQTPYTFAMALQPALDETINRTLGSMARRGIVSSSLIPEAMERIMMRIPSLWAQNLTNLARLYDILRYSAQAGIGKGATWGFQANPLAPYQLRTQQLLGLLPLI